MKPERIIRKKIIAYLRSNSNTEETNIQICDKFGFLLNCSKKTRSRAITDIKRILNNKRVFPKYADLDETPTILDKTEEQRLIKSIKQTEEKLHEEIDRYTTSIKKDNGEEYNIQLASVEPKTPEEIIALHKIDLNFWKLSQFWSKEKQNSYYTSALFRRLKPEEIDFEVIKSILKSTFNDLNILPKRVVVSDLKSNDKCLMVYLSDKHVGAMTKPDAMYGNEYNAKVFEDRMLSVLDQIERSQKDFGTFDTIMVCDLGDSVDGWDKLTTRGGHSLPQNMSNREVFNTYVETHKNFYDILFESGWAKNYKIISQVNDNHGGDFTYVVNRAVNYYIDLKYPDVETRIMEKFMEHLNYGDHTFIMTHGKDYEDMKKNMPLTLNEKTELYIEKYINYNKKDMSLYLHLIKGDLHQESQQLAYNFSYRNVLSLYGSSKWIQTNFGPQRAGASFDVVCKDSDRIYSFYKRF